MKSPVPISPVVLTAGIVIVPLSILLLIVTTEPSTKTT